MAITQVQIELEGKTPILMHNERLANPLEPIVKEIKRFTGKTKKTDDDWENIRHLEWVGSLYMNNGIVAIPVRAYSYGKGLPYAPENWPRHGDIWHWKVGSRASGAGHWADR